LNGPTRTGSIATIAGGIPIGLGASLQAVQKNAATHIKRNIGNNLNWDAMVTR
jgi:hypothetical protein